MAAHRSRRLVALAVLLAVIGALGHAAIGHRLGGVQTGPAGVRFGQPADGSHSPSCPACAWAHGLHGLPHATTDACTDLEVRPAAPAGDAAVQCAPALGAPLVRGPPNGFLAA